MKHRLLAPGAVMAAPTAISGSLDVRGHRGHRVNGGAHSLSHARNYSSLRNLNTREWRCNLRSSLHRGPCLLFIQRCTGSEIRAPRHARSRLHRARLKRGIVLHARRGENKSTASFITARRRPLHRYMQQLVTCRKNKHANATKSYYMKRARD